MPAGGPCGGLWPGPPGPLEHDVPPRLLGDGRFEPAHDAGQRDRALGVCHDDVGRLERALDAVQGDEPLAPAGHAHEEQAPRQQVEVESMQRLTRVPERIVGGVDRGRDRLCADRGQAPAHQLRRGPVLDLPHQSSAEAAAEVGNLDHDGRHLLGRFAARVRLRIARGEVAQRPARHGRDFAGQPPVPHRVRPIRGDLGLENGVVAAGLGGLDRDACLLEQPPHAVGAADGLDVHEIREPVEGELHACPENCDRKRSSPSKSRRRSGKPYFRSATRSIPRPKAKPVNSSGSIATPCRTRG